MHSRAANESASDLGEITTAHSTRLGERLLPLPRGLEALVKCLHRYVEAEPSRFEVVERGGGENCVKLVLLRKGP